jgi:hypothetical protein
MRAAILLLVIAAASGAQQTAPYSELRLRIGAVSNTSAGAIGDDWTAKTGFAFDVATPLSEGDLGLGLAHVGYTSSTGKPAYDATIFSLSWLSTEVGRGMARVSAGVRLSDYRMDFNDPSLVGGLRTEEEVMPAVLARGRLVLTSRWSLVADGSYGLLMLGHRTPMTFVSAGGQATVGTPGWLRDFLR